MTDPKRTAERDVHPLIADEQATTIRRLEAEVERLTKKCDDLAYRLREAKRYVETLEREVKR